MRLDEFAFDSHAGVTQGDEIAGIGLEFDIVPTFVLVSLLHRVFAQEGQVALWQGATESVEIWQAQRQKRVSMNGISAVIPVIPNEPVILMLRQRDLTGAYITQAALSSIMYAVFDLSSDDPTTSIQSGDMSVVDTVFDRCKLDDRWTNDQIGYNFLHVLDAFPQGNHFYAVFYQFLPTASAEARFARVVPVKTSDFHGTLP